MSEFKPLNMQRAIRDDGALAKAEKALLWAAVLRTDNNTRKVKASLEVLAKDAGYHPNTAKAAFRDTNKPVMRYFEKVERSKRKVNLWFHATVESTTTVRSDGDSESTTTVRSEDAWEVAEKSRAQPMCADSTTTVLSEHNHCAPAASICSTSASTPNFSRPSSLAGDDEAQDTATPAGPLPEEPLSRQGQAPEVEIVEQKPCGCTPGLSCPTCWGGVVRPQKHPDFKLKGWHGDHLERDEGLNEYGEPIGLDY